MTLDYDCLSLGTLAPSAGQRTIGQSYRDTSVIVLLTCVSSILIVLRICVPSTLIMLLICFPCIL